MAYASSIAFGLGLPPPAPSIPTEDIFKGQHHLNKQRESSSLSAQSIRKEMKYCLLVGLLKSEHIETAHESYWLS